MTQVCSLKMVKAFEKFNDELFRFTTETGDNTLYEDAFTTRNVCKFKLAQNGTLTWIEDGRQEREKMFDDDEAKDWLKFWKACLRRAKKYWSMDTETLDAIYDFKKEDINIEED